MKTHLALTPGAQAFAHFICCHPLTAQLVCPGLADVGCHHIKKGYGHAESNHPHQITSIRSEASVLLLTWMNGCG
jgi:hypothetical protein